mgnify:CR=1 FL=1
MPKPKKKPSRSKKSSAANAPIEVIGAHQNNLKGFDVEIPRGELTVVTGPSGSGKSSLAFHTLYAEGQRRYVETFSPYVRQFLDRMDKPKVDEIRGIPPAIAIEQKNQVRTTRSTVGTLTEINDYLKLLYPRMAVGKDPDSGEEIRPQSAKTVVSWAVENLSGETLLVVFPVLAPSGAEVSEFFEFLFGQGFVRVMIYGEIFRTDEPESYGERPLPAEVLVIQDRIKIGKGKNSRQLEALESGFKLGKGELGLARADGGGKFEVIRRFRSDWKPLVKPTAGLFSFNSPIGACPKCRGFGRVIGLDLDKAIPDDSLSIEDGCVKAFQGDRGQECQDDLERCAAAAGISISVPFSKLDEDEQDWVRYGEPGDTEEVWQAGGWYGVQGFFNWLETKAYKMHVRVFLSRYRSYTTCPTCRGRRLQPMALNFTVAGKTLPQLWQMPVGDLFKFVSEQVTEPADDDSTTRLVLNEIRARLGYLCDVGLSYLTLDRATRTLSGGEVERVNLTTCLGASLTNTLFVLDEPTVGLHARDIERLIGVMHGLRDKGNTLVVVEHEEQVMNSADHLLDIGPGSGEYGGELVYQGAPKDLTGTLTGDFLQGRRKIEVPKRRKTKHFIKIRGASRHNLKQVDVDIPLGVLCGITGVSGSGKSTLVHDVIYQNLAKQFGKSTDGEAASIKALSGFEKIEDVVLVDQSPLARTPRSTPAVFIGAFDAIRTLFARSPDGQAQGLTPGFFSFNSGPGRCQRCWGTGSERVEMQFLSDVFITCPECSGRRYTGEALEIKWNGKSIADMLEMSVDETLKFLAEVGGEKPETQIRKAATALQPLSELGLGYLRLGQPLTTLSGGESQRLKLVGHLGDLAKAGKGHLLIFDEPTTGLHFGDVERLLAVFQRLVDEGHSVLVIEHHLEVIKCCDYLIDLGPEAGADGGQIVATGTPEQVVEADTVTSQFLAPLLDARLKSRKVAEEVAAYRTLSEAARLPTDTLSVRGAREHNLKNISVDLPKDELVVITGLSGSGKSTLAFDIVFAEGQRRFLDSMSPYARQFAEQLQKPDIDLVSGLPPTVAIEQRVSRGGGKSTVATVTEIWHFLRLLYSKTGTQHCPQSGVPVVSQTASAIVAEIRKELKKGPVTLLAPVIRGRKGYHTDVAKWALKQGFETLLVDRQFKASEGFERLERFVEHDIDVVLVELEKGSRPKTVDLQAWVDRALDIGKGSMRLLDSSKSFRVLSTAMVSPVTGRSFEALDPRLFSYNSPHGWCPECRGYGRIPKKRIRLRDQDSVLEEEMAYDKAMNRKDDEETVTCDVCDGARMNEVARAVRIGEMRLEDFASASVSRAREKLAKLPFTGTHKIIARDILPELDQRLQFLEEVGLSYLQLDRSATTLSGGESQRIRLAAQLGSNLQGVLYVLDEPTIGLHPRDNENLLDTLEGLRDRGNSLLVVEHDDETLRRADHVLDLGPGAGRLGGDVVYSGKLPNLETAAGAKKLKTLLKQNPQSNTLRSLVEETSHPMSGERRSLPKPKARSGWLKIDGASANNLKDLNLQIPVGRLTVLTGISGSGKSSFMRGVLKPAADSKLSKVAPKNTTKAWKKLTGFEQITAVYEVDQAPIGKTSRSTPATYVKLFDHIRKLFALTPEARLRGFTHSRFSFNNKEGQCPDCKGNGRIKLEMDFLPSSWIHCEHCDGLRYNPATLEVTYKGKSIGEVLQMSISEAVDFFDAVPRIHRTLKLLDETGLGYLQLGQPSPTVSGGEAQRIKLVTELTRGVGRSQNDKLRGVGKEKSHLYLIEEPTIGLHHQDVRRLIEVLHRLVDDGHTVVVIEHNTEVMAEADYLIDIGPEAGPDGGELVAHGPPEEVIKSRRSRTAPFIAAQLKR